MIGQRRQPNYAIEDQALGEADDREGIFVVTTTQGRFTFAAGLATLIARLQSGAPSVDVGEQIVFIAPEHVVSVHEVDEVEGDPLGELT